jgi:acylphosphatase
LERSGGEAAVNENTRHLVVTGEVQGVGFRYSMALRAEQLGVTGWVRNRRDGSVEAMIEGPPEQLAALIEWARRGPPSAAVAHVAVELGTGSYTGFAQYPTA